MAVAFVASNGTGVFDGTGDTLTYTTTRQIEAGEHVVVVSGNNGGSKNILSVTVGALSLVLDYNPAGFQTHQEVWSARATATIASGSNVVVILTSPGVTSCIHGMCFSLSGVLSSGWVDVTKEGTFTVSTTPSTGATSSTALAGSIAIGAVRYSLSSVTTSAAGGYTEIAEINDATANHSTQCEYLLLPATGTQNATWTLSGNATGDTLIVVYKPASTGAPGDDPPIGFIGRGAGW